MKNEERENKTPQDKARLEKYQSELRRLRDWFEQVSAVTIHPDAADSIRFELHAYGVCMPPQEYLTISVVGCPESGFQFGMDRDALKKLGKWCIECAYLLDSLREKKEEQIQRAKREFAEIHERKSYKEWSGKAKRH